MKISILWGYMDFIYKDYKNTYLSIHYLCRISMFMLFCIHCLTILVFDKMPVKTVVPFLCCGVIVPYYTYLAINWHCCERHSLYTSQAPQHATCTQCACSLAPYRPNSYTLMDSIRVIAQVV